MKFKHLLIFICIFAAFLTNLQSQLLDNESVKVLVKGTILDEFSREPVGGVTMEFRNDDGKKMKIQSNLIDGKFEQLFNAGKSYTLIFSAYNIIRESKTFDVEPSAKFIEVNKDLYVKRLNEGLVLNKLDAFTDGGKDLSEEAKTKLDELKEILKFNRSAKFVIKINAHDTYSQKYFAPEPANKNKNKGKKSSTPKPEQNTPAIDPQIITALVDARVNEIKKITDTWGSFGQRVSFAPDYTVGEPSQIKLPDLMLVVGKIENVFRKSEGD